MPNDKTIMLPPGVVVVDKSKLTPKEPLPCKNCGGSGEVAEFFDRNHTYHPRHKCPCKAQKK